MRKNIFSLLAGVITALTFTLSLNSFAETSNVNVYGTLNLTAESVSATGASANGASYASRNRIQSNTSHFGMKGSEEIGKDMKGIFQIEVGIDGTMNQFVPNANFLNIRNTGVGIEAHWGQLMLGIWDTPFRTSTLFMEPFYNTTTGTLSALIDSIGSAPGTANAASSGGNNTTTFFRRQGNSLQYWSPNLWGFTLKAMYSANIDRNPPGLDGVNPDLLSTSLSYELDGFNAAIAYEQHDDFRSAAGAINTINTKDTGIKAATGYRFGNTQLGAIFSSLRYVTQGAGGETNYNRPAYGASLIHHFGDFALRLAYTRAADGDITEPTKSASVRDWGASHGIVGFSYSFTKRTDIFTQYNRIWNKSAATYNYQIDPINPLVGFGVGADPQVVAFGIRHTF